MKKQYLQGFIIIANTTENLLLNPKMISVIPLQLNEKVICQKLNV